METATLTAAHTGTNFADMSTATLTKYRISAKVDLMNEPFVDWYSAETEEQAREMWKADALKYGVPVEKTVLTVEAQ